MTSALIAAELTWIDGRLERDRGVEIGADGLVAAVVHLDEIEHEPTIELRGAALLPGFVNAHSHAFQRGLRGRGETFPESAGSFWTWREAMYGLVESLDPDRLYELSRLAFDEMLDAGITTVGEFHYVHHVGSERFDGDLAVLAAARDAGIRIVLLEALYTTGDVGRPLSGGQLRFEVRNPDELFEQIDRLSTRLTAGQSLGAVAHSIRAVPPDDLATVVGSARERELVLHMHVEEQRPEIERSTAAWERTPIELLIDSAPLDHVTAVHCTHTTPDSLRRFLDAGGSVCVCPLTEANLGDGIPDLAAVTHDAALCLGTDSNARISMFDEMRWLEYGQRWRFETRGGLRDQDGEVAPRLLEAATSGGASALGLDTGQIAAGRPADLVAVALDPTATDPETAPAALVFGADERRILGVAVNGRWLRPLTQR